MYPNKPSLPFLYFNVIFFIINREDDRYISSRSTSYNHSNCIYVHRISYNDQGSIVRSCDFFQSDSIALLHDVHDFEIQHQYMFATKQVVSINIYHTVTRKYVHIFSFYEAATGPSQNILDFLTQ